MRFDWNLMKGLKKKKGRIAHAWMLCLLMTTMSLFGRMSAQAAPIIDTTMVQTAAMPGTLTVQTTPAQTVTNAQIVSTPGSTSTQIISAPDSTSTQMTSIPVGISAQGAVTPGSTAAQTVQTSGMSSASTSISTGASGVGSGPWGTLTTRAWMDALGVKDNRSLKDGDIHMYLGMPSPNM